MRNLLTILFCFVSIALSAQTVLTIEGIDTTVVTNQGYDVSRNSVTTLTISKNKFSSGLNTNFILQAGEDTYNASTDNNLDGGIISGNLIEWTGNSTYPASLMHGIMAGYQKNYTIKHNYFDEVPYSVVFKSGNDEAMTYTSGGHSYNIHYNSRAIYPKGMSGVRIYNNTFYNTRHDYSISPAIYITENDGSEQDEPFVQATGTDIKNNIFYRKYNRSFITLVGADVTDDFECDYNIYWCENSTNNEPRFSINGTGYSWAQWRALGYDTHSYIVNPDFIDTVTFVPSSRLNYGVNLGESYDDGLSISADWVVGEYPDTTEQGDAWQVGAVLYSSGDIGGDYFVATDGNNANPGTFASPWATLQYAMSNVEPGDTVYIRGGIYYTTSEQGIRSNPGLVGTAENPICFFNYPGETPIIDGTNKTSQSHGITLSYSSFIKFRGIVVRNHAQFSTTSYPHGFNMYYCTDITFENCTVHDVDGRGFANRWCDRMTFINCDAYNIADMLTSSGAGGNGDGFFMSPSYHNFTGQHYFYGCRAWQCSDDGWDIENLGLTVVDSCWSFNNGYEAINDPGLGNGFKLNLSPAENVSQLSRIFVNNVAAYNRRTGITTNDNNNGARWMHIYNNTSYANGLYGQAGYGFQVYSTNSSEANEAYRIFRNNIAYANTTLNMRLVAGAAYTSDHNTWDGGVTVNNLDFISLDSTGLAGARQTDGSLPYLDFLRLASTSDLIGAGADLGYGTDLGAHQYTVPEEGEEVEPLVIFTTGAYPSKTSATVNGNVYDDGGGTISARGVCWSLDADPETTDNVVTVSGTTGTYTATITGLTSGETYHVRAFATNEAGTRYGADLEFTTTATSFVKSGTKYLLINGKWLRL